MKKLKNLIIFICGLFLAAKQPIVTASVDQFQIISGPYLQYAYATAMTVMWITNKKSLSYVEFGTDQTQLQKIQKVRNGRLELNNTIHKFHLTNLTPGQHYFYRVVSKEITNLNGNEISFGEEIVSDIFEFETIDPKVTEFSFVHLCDIHDDRELLNHLLEQATSKNFDLLFYNGDMADYFYSEEQICQLVLNPSVSHFARNTPFIWVRGNHECRGIWARHIIDYLDTPDNQYYYSFDYGPVHFIILDTGENHYDDEDKMGDIGRFKPYRTEQVAWLRQEYQTVNYKSAKYRIVVCHIPFYFSNDNNPEIEQAFGDVLNEGKIDLMLCGHLHAYLSLAPEKKRHNFPVIVGGGELASAITLFRVNVMYSQLIVQVFNADGKLRDEVIVPVK